MTLDPEGFVHIADDGVARSYTANNTVIDYAPLSNEQLKQMVSQSPAALAKDREHLMQVFDVVDGHDVTDKKQIFEPPPLLQPASVKPVSQPQSRSEPQEAVAALVDKRVPMCLGRPCTTTAACVAMECVICAIYDRIGQTLCLI